MREQKDRRARRNALALTVAALAALAGRTGRAQSSTGSGFAVDRFEPSGGGSDWFSLESLDFRGRVRPAFGLILDGAWKPLVVFDQNGNPVATMLRDQIVGHADAAVVLKDRLRLDVNLPVVLHQQGMALILNDQTYAAPAQRGLGDVRLGADLRLLRRGRGTVHRGRRRPGLCPDGLGCCVHRRRQVAVLAAAAAGGKRPDLHLGRAIRLPHSSRSATARWRPATS